MESQTLRLSHPPQYSLPVTPQHNGYRLVLINNMKSYMSFRLVPKSVISNDLEGLNGVMAVTLHCVISLNLVNRRCRKRSVAEFMQESIVFLVRVQCRRKESSRSLYHLLTSFLLLSLSCVIFLKLFRQLYLKLYSRPTL